MATILEVAKNFNALDLLGTGMEVLMDMKRSAVQVQQNQLLEGLDKDGKKLQDYQSDTYASMKNRMNPRAGFGTPDLRLTGSFYEAITIEEKNKRAFNIYSKDKKNARLKKKYGSKIFGYNKESRQELIDKEGYRVNLIKKIKEKVKL